MCKIEEIKVLIVEDDDEQRNLLKHLLKKYNDIYFASSILEAKQSIRNIQPHILITDIMFNSEPTGLELLPFAKQFNEDTIIIVVTGFPENAEIMQTVLGQNVDRIFTKPLNLENFMNFIELKTQQILNEYTIKNYDQILNDMILGIDSVPMAILITDIDGNIEFANPYFSELTGYSIQEVIGKKPSLIKSGVHTPEYYENLWNTILSGKVWQGELCNKKKSGELYWDKAIISPLFKHGEISGFAAFKMDITEQRQRDLELAAILSSMDDNFLIFNHDYVCIKNHPVKSLITKIDKSVGKHVKELLPENYATELISIFEKIDSGTIEPITWYLSLNHEKQQLNLECSVKRFNSNKYIVWARDITDKVKLRVLSDMRSNISKIIESNEKLLTSLGVNSDATR